MIGNVVGLSFACSVFEASRSGTQLVEGLTVCNQPGGRFYCAPLQRAKTGVRLLLQAIGLSISKRDDQTGRNSCPT